LESGPSLFEEYEWEARACKIVNAGICLEYGWQATVKEKMRGKGVDDDKDKESDQKIH